jgi:hypothetical protein
MDDLTRACLRANARYRALRHYGAKFSGEWVKEVDYWTIVLRCPGFPLRCKMALKMGASNVGDIINTQHVVSTYCACGELRKLLQEDTPEIKALIEMELLAAG